MTQANNPRLKGPVDQRDLSYTELFANLQGNILKGHGRDNTVHLFVTFRKGNEPERNAAMTWITEFAKEKIISFKEQLRQRELYKRNGTPGSLFAGIYFTNFFYKEFLSWPLDPFTDEAFKQGMAARGGLLNDLPQEKWEKGFKENVHAMILLAHDDEIELGKESRSICEAFDPNEEDEASGKIIKFGDILHVEYGSAIRNANGDGLEHFGYVDGISQPLFLQDEIDAFKSSQPFFPGGGITPPPLRYDPSAPLDLVLVPDPFVSAGEAYGSYFVFRKLEQDVKAFKEAEKELAKELQLGDEHERAGAMIIGRFEDGTPVTLSDDEGLIGSGIVNNFDYKETIGGNTGDEGARCPFHGHIRKTNPRRDKVDKERRMARRGITYGHRNVSTTIDQSFVQMPTGGVGLLFMSFQSSIERQFEFIQSQWANSENQPQAAGCIDLIIGQGNGSRKGKYAETWNSDQLKEPKNPFPNFVTLKGGEYFFAPSILFLKSLKPENKSI